MKKQLILGLAACALLSACATTRATKEAMSRAQQDIQNAESSLAAARNAGAEAYAVVNMSSARMELQTAQSEFGNRRYDKASFHAQSSQSFSANALSEIEAARKRQAEIKLRQAEEAQRKAALEAQAKSKTEAAAKKSKPAASSKPAVKVKVVKPAAKPVQQEPAAQPKEEPKKKSWWPW